MVIKGWDEGLQQLKNGSVATLYIPSALAYGPQDQRSIPGNSILIFDVQILDAHDVADQPKVEDKQIKEYLEKNHINATKTASGLYYVITQKGLGDNAKPGQKVTMNYTGKLLNGTTFDSNTDPKFNHVSPFTFNLGMGQVIKGWDEGVQLFNIGSKGTLFIPSALGYGEHGAGGQIPGNAVLVFDVEMVGIDK
jgi:FKBP-type peptidyl-prolyl cis-trans isomerase